MIELFIPALGFVIFLPDFISALKYLFGGRLIHFLKAPKLQFLPGKTLRSIAGHLANLAGIDPSRRDGLLRTYRDNASHGDPAGNAGGHLAFHNPFTNTIAAMSEKVDRRLKTALDETRLLILGVQILLGFEFQCVFQDGFESLTQGSKQLSMSALGLILISTAILIAPSMQHRIVEAGQSTPRLIRTTNMLSGAALIPLAIGMTLSAYIVTQRAFGLALGIATAGLLFIASTFSWFGLEFLVGRYQGSEKMQTSSTPLKTKIEQLLTEARLIIPGGQALLGFQFVAMLTSAFDRLPESAKMVHALALCLIGMNVIIMMTPAALHRLSFGGEDSPLFLTLGSRLVTIGPAFLAAGISAEVYVVFIKALNNPQVAIAAAVASALVFVVFWYAWPLALQTSIRSDG
jgi:hypothetical protein